MPSKELPLKGLSRVQAILDVVGMSRSTFLSLVNQGRAPKAHRLSERLTVYRNEDIHRFIKDPLNYKEEA